MSYQGWADMQTWDGSRWVSNVLRSDTYHPLENRWLTIPTNVWHRPVMADVDWSVVSFHTASDTALIEELPLDDEHPDQGSRTATAYAGRQAQLMIGKRSPARDAHRTAAQRHCVAPTLRLPRP